MTNREKINGMTDKELAWFLFDVCSFCPKKGKHCNPHGQCVEIIEANLKENYFPDEAIIDDCPYCGSSEAHFVFGSLDNKTYIKCPNCKAQSPKHDDPNDALHDWNSIRR